MGEEGYGRSMEGYGSSIGRICERIYAVSNLILSEYRLHFDNSARKKTKRRQNLRIGGVAVSVSYLLTV